ncbi:hypothetical protein CIHG_06813 [Coccidioides immitis H538.4]|uniref:Uncharacterized protein n=2 Tax=Coccidioides immitis TaxID=5501 RepID=A0A0J8RW26_COCIT|nr:hypothetical protein CIRG_04364 [Coccidioides immitis RMSCC 2394]KMU89012.1 hypothetical protein CIHG_06813 [Coccidioides immitis H538.4]
MSSYSANYALRVSIHTVVLCIGEQLELSTNVALQNPRSQRPLAAGREGDVIWDYPQQRGAESAIIGLYSPRWAASHEDRPATNMGHITATDSLKKDQKAK